MAKQKATHNGAVSASSVRVRPKSMEVARQGIRDGADFANFMSALIGDIVSGRINPVMANAACNAGGKLLKVVEMEHKYGSDANPTKRKSLVLAPGIADTLRVEA